MNLRRGAFGPGIDVKAAIPGTAEHLVTPEALAFMALLERGFRNRRAEILTAREQRQRTCDLGNMPTSLPSTAHIRADADWRIADLPAGTKRRRVELIGPADQASIERGLSAGADRYIADFEDAIVPTWGNVLNGHAGLCSAIAHRGDGLIGSGLQGNPARAGIAMRPRNWARVEEHVLVDGRPCTAAIFDFALYAFHSLRLQVAKGEPACIYLAKLDSHLEARLWNDVFSLAQDELGIARGTLRSVCDIETLGAVIEREEIAYELREHLIGLHAASVSYVSSVLRAQRARRDLSLPGDMVRASGAPCLQSMLRLVANTCHRRGALASSATPAFLPIATDSAANEASLAPVNRCAALAVAEGCDVVRVAHPALIALARLHVEKDGSVNAVKVAPDTGPDMQLVPLLDLGPGSPLPAGAVRRNCEGALRYLAGWLAGHGQVEVFNRIEDLSTIECLFALMWHWQRSKVMTLEDGRSLDPAFMHKAITVALKTILAEPALEPLDRSLWLKSASLLKENLGRENLVEACDLISQALVP